MRFFDCNARIGLPVNPGVSCPTDAEGLLSAMDRAGIERALVWHVSQLDCDPMTGNELLARAIAPHDRLVGCWTLLPSQTGEVGDLDAWFEAAARSRVKALRAYPGEGGGRNRYLLREEVVGDVLDRMTARCMPLLLSVTGGVGWQEIYDLLASYPELTVILCDLHVWGCDRYFRPLVERYPNLHIETSGYMLDGGIEAFVADYGHRRLLFGSGFPAAYHGSMMLALAHAEIAPEAKEAITAGNLERILEGARA